MTDLFDPLAPGAVVEFRWFYADVLPGRRARVIRVSQPPGHHGPRCVLDFGRNAGGQQMRKTVPLNVVKRASEQL